MLRVPTPVRRTGVLLFLSVAFIYMSLAPGTVGGRGYVSTELDSAIRMLDVFNAWMKHRPILPMLWTQHGPFPVFFDLPFIKLGKFFVSSDFVLSLEPALSTALAVMLLYLWLRKLSSPCVSLLLSLTAAFGTMLWPYAYIGLETKQTLFVMLAGYLAISNGKIRGWGRLLLMSTVCGFAMTMKSTGIVLWPAMAYLLYVQFRDDWRSRFKELLVSAAVVGGLLALGSWTQGLYWRPLGGGAQNILPWMIRSPLMYFINAIGMFGSPTKGILIYAPILVASLFSLPRAFRQHRDVTVYCVLVTACTVGFMSLMKYGADEVWGSRYMHIAIAPLVLCIGAAWPRFEWRRYVPIVALSIFGVIVSFLGAFYYYGVDAFAMAKAGQNTMEWINGDNTWNEITLDAKLFEAWLNAGEAPVMFSSAHLWAWEAPPGIAPFATVDLREFIKPQSALLTIWYAPKSGASIWNVDPRSYTTIFRLFGFFFIAGPILLLWTVVRTIKDRWQPEAIAKL